MEKFANKTTAAPADYRQAAGAWEQYTPSLRSLRRMQRVCFLLPGVALAVMGGYFTVTASPVPGLMLFFPGIVILQGAFIQTEAVRRRRRDPNRGREVRYSFTEAEIRRSVGDREDRIPYAAVIHILETEDLFLLVCGERGDLLLRKDGFTEDAADFGAFLSQKTGRTLFHAD